MILLIEKVICTKIFRLQVMPVYYLEIMVSLVGIDRALCNGKQLADDDQDPSSLAEPTLLVLMRTPFYVQ